jgi:hypothetical protein
MFCVPVLRSEMVHHRHPAGCLAGAWFGVGWATRLRSENLYRAIAGLLLAIAVVLITGQGAVACRPLFTGVTQMVAGSVVGTFIGGR